MLEVCMHQYTFVLYMYIGETKKIDRASLMLSTVQYINDLLGIIPVISQSVLPR